MNRAGKTDYAARYRASSTYARARRREARQAVATYALWILIAGLAGLACVLPLLGVL